MWPSTGSDLVNVSRCILVEYRLVMISKVAIIMK